jgi:hypothetical protein
MTINKIVHEPTEFIQGDYKVKITGSGIVRILKEYKSSEEYDEIEVPASLCFKIVYMLRGSRKNFPLDE